MDEDDDLAWIYKDPDHAILRDACPPSWPVPDPYDTMEIGCAPVDKQLAYIRAHPDQMFEISVGDISAADTSESGGMPFWRQWEDQFAACPNIQGFGGPNLSAADFKPWTNARYVFAGEGSQGFDAADFPRLTSIRGSFQEGDRGVPGHPELVSIFAAYSARRKVDLSLFNDVPKLQHLGVSAGTYLDLDPLADLSGLKVLTLRGARQLASISAAATLSALEFIWLEDAKKVSSFEPLLQCQSLKKVILVDCGAQKKLRPIAEALRANGVTVSI